RCSRPSSRRSPARCSPPTARRFWGSRSSVRPAESARRGSTGSGLARCGTPSSGDEADPGPGLDQKARPVFLSIGSVVIDDIVLPDGRTRMGVLGGGAAHAAMGMRVWTPRVALLAALGRDVPETDRQSLTRAFEVRSPARPGAPSPRAWQLYESDGRRTHVDRTAPER